MVALLITVLLIGVILWVVKNNFKSRSLRYNSFSNEHDRIQALVESRKAEADKKGIRKSIENLWVHESVRYLPSWISKNREAVAGIIDDAIELNKTRDNKEYSVIELKLKSKTIAFAFTERGSFDGVNYGELDLLVNDQLVMSLCMAIDYRDPFNDYWHSIEIKSYIPGDWESDIGLIQSAMSSIRIHNERRAKENPEKLNDLKKRFGIE